MVDNTVDGKDNREEETMQVSDIVCITSIIIIGLLLLIEDVVNFDVITHTEAVKHV